MYPARKLCKIVHTCLQLYASVMHLVIPCYCCLLVTFNFFMFFFALFIVLLSLIWRNKHTYKRSTTTDLTFPAASISNTCSICAECGNQPTIRARLPQHRSVQRKRLIIRVSTRTGAQQSRPLLASAMSRWLNVVAKVIKITLFKSLKWDQS